MPVTFLLPLEFISSLSSSPLERIYRIYNRAHKLKEDSGDPVDE